MRQLFAESLLLAVAGSLGGLLLASWAGELLLPRVLRQVRMSAETGIDGRVLAFVALLTLVTALLFGLGPALAATRGRALAGRLGSRSGGGGRRASRVRAALVVAETALAVVLLVGAGLLTHSLWRLSRVDPGFESEKVLALGVSHSPRAYPDVASWSTLVSRILERTASLPGVLEAAANSHLPLASSTYSSSTVPEGAPRDDDDAYVNATFEIVSPAYHRAMGIPFVAGRDFDAGDHGESLPVVVISESLARSFWPGEPALGKRLDFESHDDEPPRYRTVVGVVGDVKRYGLDQPSQPAMYVPHTQPSRWLLDRLPEMTLVVRVAGDPMALVGPIGEAVREIDSDLPVAWPRTLEGEIERSTAGRRLWSTLLGMFAACALLLAAVGLYGVLAYTVGSRRHEIGVRLALGAEARRILSWVLFEGLALVGLGAALGLAASVAGARLLGSLLYEVHAVDPLTYGVVASGLAVVALVACLGPALRAARVDPAVALEES